MPALPAPLPTSTRSRSRTLRGAVAGLGLAIGLAACTGTADAPGAPDVTATGGSATTAAATPTALPDPTVGLTAVGWLEAAGPFADLPLGDTPVEDWPDLFATLSATAGAAGPAPSTPTTIVERDPDACTLWRVLVTDVAFDAARAPGAARMRAELLATLTGIDHDAGPLLGEGDAPWCEGRGREGLAWYATVVTPAACALPDQAPLACVTVTTMRYDGGAHPNLVATDLVLDPVTGRRYDAAALLELRGLDVAATTASVEATVCDLDRAAGLVDAGQDCWPIALRNIRPTATGVVLAFSPYESGPYALGARDLFVPWADLAAGAQVAVAVRAAHRALRAALASGDWVAVAALVPADGAFLVGTGARVADPVGLLRGLPRDPRPELFVALAQRPGTLAGETVWPELALRDPFVLAADERDALVAASGADAVAAWERAGRYTGWRVGFDADGTWRFAVAGE
jgi:hypothetical protein